MTLAQQNVELASLADRAKAVRLLWGDSPEEKNVFDTVRRILMLKSDGP